MITALAAWLLQWQIINDATFRVLEAMAKYYTTIGVPIVGA